MVCLVRKCILVCGVCSVLDCECKRVWCVCVCVWCVGVVCVSGWWVVCKRMGVVYASVCGVSKCICGVWYVSV